ncbi:proteasome subunit alpha type-3 [Toxorhynchites rutilus septentrionalis]|uniref:proteasome subunit alpha type-3 n=1 Tax=Toxorhynchites rutilus septentrionalis TaxID=329112 RepID=UPI00247A69C2|nr:proteasome subunit alpha type-3 [Toxorhynchites rutilus septentrionalis]
MSSIGTGYDLSASQFSPDGRVFQIEYAAKSVENSGTVIGLRGKDGVVLAVEKLITSKLYEPDSGTRIFTIDMSIGMAISGMIADGRAIVDIARQEAANYRQQNNRPIPLKQLNDRLSSYFHAYTLYSAVRPFGVSVVLATWTEDNGPEMYMIDPSGVSCGYFGCAVGKAKQTAKTEIEKLKLADMSVKDLITTAGKIIYQVHDELKDKDFKLELSWVCQGSNGRHQMVPDELYIAATRAGQEAVNEDDSDNDI